MLLLKYLVFLSENIIESITNALPIKIAIKSIPAPALLEPASSVLENLQALSPELVPNDTISVPHAITEISNEVLIQNLDPFPTEKFAFKMPKVNKTSNIL